MDDAYQEGGNTPVKMYDGQWWTAQLDRDERSMRDNWWNYADKIVKKYLAKKNGEDDQYLLNLFWSNVGIMKAALYARPPRPMVKRTFDDQNDDVTRVSANILQRALSQDLMKNVSPMSEAIKLAVEDRLIPGLGMIWMRYVPTIEQGTIPAVQHPVTGEELFPSTDYEEITNEEVVCEYVHWRDVVYPAARTADEVWYIGRKLYKSYGEIKSRFGDVVARKLRDTVGDKEGRVGDILPKNFSKDKIEMYEIWCKKNKKVYWFSRHCPDGLLGVSDDPLELDDFFPCPNPLMATHTTNNFMPRPDYYMLKDQYDQLTELNTRITILEKAMRVVGLYDKKNSEIKRILSDARENDMIPVENWAVLSEKGGMKGQVDWFPLEQVANVLQSLTTAKQAKMDEIYMLTGISDIMRGDTGQHETLGAQQMKANFSSIRLQYLQDEVAIFVKQALVIKAEIMCKHFQDESLLATSQILLTPDAQLAPAAIQMLRASRIVHYRIDINEESLALPDYTQESQARTDFLKNVGQFMSQAAPLAQEMPGTMPYLIQMIRWVAGGMRGASEIQGVLDKMFEQMQQTAQQQQSQPPQPDPKVQVAQIKYQDNKGKAMSDAAMQRVQVQAKAEETAQNNATQILVAQQEGLNAEKSSHLQASTDLLQERLEHVHRINEIEAQQANSGGV